MNAKTALLAICLLGCSAGDASSSDGSNFSSGPNGSKAPAPGGSSSSGGSHGADAAPPPPPFVTAQHPPLPQIVSKGGPVLSAPKLIAFTFANDPLQAQIDDFMSKVGASSYWKTVMKDYGVGPATGKVVHVPQPAPASVDDNQNDNQIEAFIRQHIGAPDPEALYTVFYPQTTTINAMNGTMCQEYGGYHTWSPSYGFAYAVVPRCKGFLYGKSDIDEVTYTATHEFAEAATDPITGTQEAFSRPDDLAWYLVSGGEVGDMCTYLEQPSLKPSDFPFEVARIWSNSSAKAGTDPCLPSAASGPYFNVSAVLPDAFTVNDPWTRGSTMTVKGLKLAVGQSKTFEIDLFSDRATGDWKLSGVGRTEYMQGSAPVVNVSFDKATGKNGDKVKVTVKLLQTPPGGAEPFLIQSTLGGTTNIWIGAVGG
jgi:hypothetical protein